MNIQVERCTRCGKTTSVSTSMAVVEPPEGESKRGKVVVVCARCLHNPEPPKTMEREE